MKMAKEQGMALNTNKISGICDKLMCCIAYEHELYQELKKVPVIFKSMQKSTHLKYKIEGFFCKISLPLFYKLIIAL